MITYFLFNVIGLNPFWEMDTSVLSAIVTSTMKNSASLNIPFVSFRGRNCVTLLNVIMLNVIMLNVVAPLFTLKWQFYFL